MPSSAGTKRDAAGVGDRRGERVGRSAAVDEPEVVAKPLDAGAGGEHHRLEAPGQRRRRGDARRSGSTPRRPGARTWGAPRAPGRASPPVPKVSLPCPGSTQPWPASEACWSPTIAQIGGAPRSALADTELAARCRRSRAGARGRGRARPATWASQSTRRASTSPVTPALVASVTCSSPFESTWATQVSIVPKRSVPEAASPSGACATSHRSLVAEALGASAHALALQARGSRPPCAGPAIRSRVRRARRSPHPRRPSSPAGS